MIYSSLRGCKPQATVILNKNSYIHAITNTKKATFESRFFLDDENNNITYSSPARRCGCV
jgi:hypothetical protein